MCCNYGYVRAMNGADEKLIANRLWGWGLQITDSFLKKDTDFSFPLLKYGKKKFDQSLQLSLLPRREGSGGADEANKEESVA